MFAAASARRKRRGGHYPAVRRPITPEQLAAAEHEVTIIDSDPDVVSRYEPAGEPKGVSWVQGDACEIGQLGSAGVESADVVAAVTGDDEDNLVISLLAKQEFGVPRVVARVNNPKNEWMFNQLWGVDVAVSTPHLITALVQEAVSVGSFVRLLSFEGGKARLAEVTLAEGSPAADKEIVELGLPRDATVVAIVRQERVVVPRGDTLIRTGDEVIVLVTSESEDEVRAIGEWAVEHGIWVVTDEIYEHLTYGDNRFVSMPAVVPELADQCVVLNGVAKTYAMTGWRVGWMIGPADFIKAATNLQSHMTSNVANVSQRAALAAVAGDLDAVAEMRAAFARRGAIMHKLLREIPGVTCLEPQGAFYAFPSFEGVLGREIAGRTPTTTLELAEVVLDRAKVAIVPGEAFGAPGFARLSFALGDDDLVEGVTRIADLLAS